MLFSVVIPLYNAQSSIAETLASVEAQNFADCEIVLVDDGSEDGSIEVLSRFERDHKNVVLLRQSNSGVFQARRAGALACSGEYILFLDADDRLRPDALEVIANALVANSADLVSFRYTTHSDFADDRLLASFLPAGLYKGKELQDVRRQVCMGHFNSVWAKAIRRSAFLATLSYEPSRRVSFGEDLLQIQELIDFCDSVLQLDDVLYYYRSDTPSGATSSFSYSQLVDIEYVTSRLVFHAKRWGPECYRMALCGRAEQYLYLVQINELSAEKKQEMERHFMEICDFLDKNKVFAQTPTCKMRLDHRFALFLMRFRLYAPVRIMIKAKEYLMRASCALSF